MIFVVPPQLAAQAEAMIGTNPDLACPDPATTADLTTGRNVHEIEAGTENEDEDNGVVPGATAEKISLIC